MLFLHLNNHTLFFRPLLTVQVLGVEWHGEASLYDGWMRGLASVHRSGEAAFIRNAEGRILGMLATLGLGDMKVREDYQNTPDISHDMTI